MIGRRMVLGGMAATAALWAGPGLAATRRPAKLPARLREGDTVGLVCPAGFIADEFGLAEIEGTVRAMGLVPKSAPNMLDRHGYLAGPDPERARALQDMFEDEQVRAIFAVRGGWGAQRLLPYLDFKAIRAHPKLLVGSSDITALHLAIAARAGFPTIHGPNLAHSWPLATWQGLRDLAFDAAMPVYEPPAPDSSRLSSPPAIRTLRGGTARGRLLGGNLSVLSAMVGTPWLPDFSGAILFLEDVNEAEYRIDRMLTQIAQAGIFGQLAGVVFGQCTNCRNPGSPYGNFTIYEVLAHHLSGLGIPAFQGARIGHISNQLSIPVGVEAELDADKGSIRIFAPAVA